MGGLGEVNYQAIAQGAMMMFMGGMGGGGFGPPGGGPLPEALPEVTLLPATVTVALLILSVGVTVMEEVLSP